MAHHDLKSAETIRALFSRFAAEPPDGAYHLWREELVSFLDWVAKASTSQRVTVEFHQRLWNDNKVSSVGRGSISVDAVIEDADVRQWLARISFEPVPAAPAEAVAYLEALYDEIVERVRPHCRKIPRLKIFRILAAFFPRHFTTVCDRSVMEHLHEAMFAAKGEGSVARHLDVLRRLQEILGPPPADLPGLVLRMTFAWYLAEATDEGVDDDRPVRPGPPGAEKLIPLPAIRRRRGLTSIRGYITPVMGTLEFAREGVTRDELLAYLRSQYPGSKETSLSTIINVLQAELHVLRRDGDRYVLTRSGESLLESDDPSVLAPWFITRILGVDHALVSLRDQGDQLRADLVPKIKLANPGWTSDWTPHSILSWLKSIGFVDIASNGLIRLTELGKEWAGRIDWIPGNLPREDEEPTSITPATALIESAARIVLPPFEQIYETVSTAGRFDRGRVATLHAGIWAHPRRHFAIMTGLSGAGKTLLAIHYGRAITRATTSDDQIDRVCIVTVQPGWSDASALLGYVNPLRPDTYVRTPFLDFLVTCASDLGHPYVVVLDEMNLSHPEQYLAPLLSAMETGGFVELHREDEIFDGVPARLNYPSNLVLIGTVNMDETTHGLSDKVLDRAFTLEFWYIDVDEYPRWGARGIPEDIEASVRAALRNLVEALAPARLHFGWRVIDDVLDFMVRTLDDGLGLDPTGALDAVVYAKVIPKLRGDDSPRFRDALEACRRVLQGHDLRASEARVADLLRDLTVTGTARFWR